jgi:hypothetical protein
MVVGLTRAGWTLVIQHLELEDRARCKAVCRLFRAILDAGEHSVGLLPLPKRWEEFTSAHLRDQAVQRLFQSRFSGCEAVEVLNPYTDAHGVIGGLIMSFGEMWRGDRVGERHRSQRATSCGDFLITSGQIDPTRIWNSSRKVVCEIPALGLPFSNYFEVFQLDNWLVREAISETKFMYDVWEIDGTSGSAKQLQSDVQELAEPQNGRVIFVAPQRAGDRLTVPLPDSAKNSFTVELREDGLILCNKRHLIKPNSKCRPRVSVDNCLVRDGWLFIFKFPHAEGLIRISLYDLNQPEDTLIQEHASLLYKNNQLNPNILLEKHHFVMYSSNVCYVYTLWNLDPAGPNRSYEFSRDIQKVFFHGNKLHAQTVDNVVWRLET